MNSIKSISVFIKSSSYEDENGFTVASKDFHKCVQFELELSAKIAGQLHKATVYINKNANDLRGTFAPHQFPAAFFKEAPFRAGEHEKAANAIIVTLITAINKANKIVSEIKVTNPI